MLKQGSNGFHLTLLDESAEPLTLLHDYQFPWVNSTLTPTWKRNSMVVTRPPATLFLFLGGLRKHPPLPAFAWLLFPARWLCERGTWFWRRLFQALGTPSSHSSLPASYSFIWSARNPNKGVAHVRQSPDHWAISPASLFIFFPFGSRIYMTWRTLFSLESSAVFLLFFLLGL